MGRLTVGLIGIVMMAACAGRPTPIAFPLVGPSLAPNWTGEYRCEGADGDGDPYTDLGLTIAKQKDTYTLVWHLPAGIINIGVALPLDSVLVVGYSTGQFFGPAIYRWEDGVIVGRWTAWGAAGKIFTQSCHAKAARAVRR